MFRYFAQFLCLLASLCVITAYAATTPSLNPKPVLGKDYEVLTTAKVTASPAAREWLTADQGKVEVIEFFSYGCPACNLADPALQNWLKTKPKDVVFRRVPVIFHPEWETYARTFYVLEAMGLEEKLHSALFNAIHQRNLNLTSQTAMRNFLSTQGVDAATFDKLYQSFGLSGSLNRSNALQAAYNIMEIPSLVVNGHYRSNYSLAKGNDPRFILILNTMIESARKG